MNGYNVIKFVFQKSRIATVLIYLSILGVFAGIGAPNLLTYWTRSPLHTNSLHRSVMEWINTTRTTWLVFAYAFNPSCSLIVILYIVSVKHRRLPLIDRALMLLEQQRFVCLVISSWSVIIVHYFLQFIRNGTDIISDDYTIIMVSCISSCLIEVNQFLSILYVEYFPVVFQTRTKNSVPKTPQVIQHSEMISGEATDEIAMSLPTVKLPPVSARRESETHND